MAHKSNAFKGLVGNAWVLPIRDQVMLPGAILTLQISRPASESAVHESISSDRLVLAVTQRLSDKEAPFPKDLYDIGTLAEVVHSVPMPDGTTRLVLKGLKRCRISEWMVSNGASKASYQEFCELPAEETRAEAFARLLKQSFDSVAVRNEQIPTESIESISESTSPLSVAFLITHFLPCEAKLKQAVLEELDQERLFESVLNLCKKEEALLDAQDHIRARVEEDLSDVQRQFFLKEQLKAIQNELGIKGPFSEECESYRLFIESKVPEPARSQAIIELRKLEQASEGSPDIHVTRNYIQTLTRMPWGVGLEEEIDIGQAEINLDQAHFGLAAVKERIVEFLAVQKLRGSATRGAVLCFVGPPGVGRRVLHGPSPGS